MKFSREYLQGLIDGRIEESAHLEYKGAAALDRKDQKKKTEMTKDVSAFANAAGGVLIYGIKEHDAPAQKHLPACFDPVNQSEYSKEWLDQMLSQIQPRIDKLTIHPVHVGPATYDYCYVVEIPKSGTAHQATDWRYYRRRNFEATPMEDYEVREVMNRRKDPIVTAEVRVNLNPASNDHELVVRVRNLGSILARNYLVVARVPLFIDGEFLKFGDDVVSADGIDGGSCRQMRLHASPLHPLYPGDENILRKSFTLHGGVNISIPLAPSISDVHLTVFADNAPMTSEWKSFEKAMTDWT